MVWNCSWRAAPPAPSCSPAYVFRLSWLTYLNFLYIESFGCFFFSLVPGQPRQPSALSSAFWVSPSCWTADIQGSFPPASSKLPFCFVGSCLGCIQPSLCLMYCCSGAVPGSGLRSDPWGGPGAHLGCQGSNPGLRARQAPSLLSCLYHPNPNCFDCISDCIFPT